MFFSVLFSVQPTFNSQVCWCCFCKIYLCHTPNILSLTSVHSIPRKKFSLSFSCISIFHVAFVCRENFVMVVDHPICIPFRETGMCRPLSHFCIDSKFESIGYLLRTICKICSKDIFSLCSHCC